MKKKPRGILAPKGTIPGLVLPTFCRWLATESAVFAGEDSPFRASLSESDPRIVLIVGENASGKSLAFRLLQQICGDHSIVAIDLSIRTRAGLGRGEMSHMKRAFMYGDEYERSTGATSASVVRRAFANLDREQPAALLMDEPELFSHAREGCRLASALN